LQGRRLQRTFSILADRIMILYHMSYSYRAEYIGAWAGFIAMVVIFQHGYMAIVILF
jgi:hypothetical protein